MNIESASDRQHRLPQPRAGGQPSRQAILQLRIEPVQRSGSGRGRLKLGEFPSSRRH